jgi:plasmid stabilization system protein ParE
VTPSIRASSLASVELAEAVRWYESKRSGLGDDFLAETAKTIDRLALNPEAGKPISSDPQTRRLLVSRFPYQIVYRRRPDEIVIVAVAHLKRKPGYWKDRV